MVKSEAKFFHAQPEPELSDVAGEITNPEVKLPRNPEANVSAKETPANSKEINSNAIGGGAESTVLGLFVSSLDAERNPQLDPTKREGVSERKNLYAKAQEAVHVGDFDSAEKLLSSAKEKIADAILQIGVEMDGVVENGVSDVNALKSLGSIKDGFDKEMRLVDRSLSDVQKNRGVDLKMAA